jgi:hypothetical protein
MIKNIFHLVGRQVVKISLKTAIPAGRRKARK